MGTTGFGEHADARYPNPDPTKAVCTMIVLVACVCQTSKQTHDIVCLTDWRNSVCLFGPK